MTDGWFVDTMPDLNHKNNFMQEYLIQNSIWWIEELGLGGIRQDTYPYADKEFMSNWAGAIMNEYPNLVKLNSKDSEKVIDPSYRYLQPLLNTTIKSSETSDSDKLSMKKLAMQFVDAFMAGGNWFAGKFVV